MLNLRLIIIAEFDVFQSVFQSLFYAKNCTYICCYWWE